MRRAIFLSFAIVFSVASTASAQLAFNFIPAAGTPQFVIDGFNEAGALWSSSLNDAVTVDINIGFGSLSGGAIGATTPTVGSEIYSDFRTALIGDAKSAADFSSTAALQSKLNSGLVTFDVWSNRSAENPNGAGSATPYLDTFDLFSGPTNNLAILYTSANARAIGIATGSLPNGDGTITFSNAAPWDFDRSDGISFSAFDFVGVAAHEIGHVLGFTSGVDNIDATPGGSEDSNEYLSNPLDLFRFSSASLANGAGVPDMTASGTAKFFSVDGGTTSLGGFSLGTTFGDGRQASHWKDNLGLGLMDPTTALGQLLTISDLDLTGFDVIGWDLTPVPEPGTLAFLMLGISGIALRRSRP